mgnify:FL=1|jgi:hypothetical protein|tara:strand:+ start:5546 stop:5875 length:330 start_codon:yes stop_codon:yes gene_type:complete
MDHKEYIKAGGEEYANKYGAKNPYYKPEEPTEELKLRVKENQAKLKDNMWRDNKDKGLETKYPTQEDIIAFNREENRKKEQESSTVVVEKEFLEKLKDFEYWKEWKNQG